MILTFLTDYADEESCGKDVKDFTMIAMRYLKGDFVIDFVPLIPLPHLAIGHSYAHWYILKVLRLKTVSKVFDAHALYVKI